MYSGCGPIQSILLTTHKYYLAYVDRLITAIGVMRWIRGLSRPIRRQRFASAFVRHCWHDIRHTIQFFLLSAPVPKISYKVILSDDKYLLLLMKRLGLVDDVTEVKYVNHHPDYDYSEYKGPVTQTYFFKTTLTIPDGLAFVYDTAILATRIIHFDDFADIVCELELNANPDEDQEWILAEAFSRDADFIDHIGYEDIEQFSLHGLEITTIENHKRSIHLQGSFVGDGYGISQPDWGLYAVVRFMGFKEDLNDSEFYRQLLVESFSLRENGDHRVSFFLAFSALESYINWKMNVEADGGRLSDKARNLFNHCFPNVELGRHQIYTHAIADFNQRLTVLRNGIAHGRVGTINSDQSRQMLLVALLLICSAEMLVASFDEIFQTS